MQLKQLGLCLVALTLTQCKNPNPEPLPAQIEEVEQTRELVGGWKNMEVTEQVTALAAFALSEQNIDQPLAVIRNAREQIVSGKNYGFEIELENGKRFDVVIYVDLQKNKQLTKFQEITEPRQE